MVSHRLGMAVSAMELGLVVVDGITPAGLITAKTIRGRASSVRPAAVGRTCDVICSDTAEQHKMTPQSTRARTPTLHDAEIIERRRDDAAAEQADAMHDDVSARDAAILHAPRRGAQAHGGATVMATLVSAHCGHEPGRGSHHE